MTEIANEGTDVVNASINYTLGPRSKTLLVVGPGALTGNGNAANVIIGNELGNTLNGRGGIDTLIGNEGNDTLDGGTRPIR